MADMRMKKAVVYNIESEAFGFCYWRTVAATSCKQALVCQATETKRIWVVQFRLVACIPASALCDG